jgi:Ca2+-transporting ATPase
LCLLLSLVTYGRGRGIVVETGMNTEVGKIAEMIQSVDDSDTPLKRRLEELGKTLGIVAIAICLIIFIAGSLYGKNILHMFMTSVSLAVAAIPEGLPAISTIVLAIGVQRMVKRNAIVRTLPSVETLGSATVICSDKTGTLTQNKMTVEKIYYNYELYNADEKLHNVDDHLNLLIDSMIMCNDSKIKFENNKYTVTGDPTETALVDLGIKYEILKTDADDLHKRVEEIPFDSNRKLMTTVHEYEEEYMVYTKGALDELLSRCTKIYFNNQEITLTDDHVNDILQINSDLSSQALRVLAMAYKRIEMIPLKSEIDSLESNLIFIGMVGMIDPARPEAYGAVQECKEAGIKPVMITGDHKITAIAIAKDIGILSDESEAITGAELEKMSQDDLVKNVRNYSVYARVSPEHKVRIVKAWQTNGEIVAMTGDGVNDAPALKTSDIGAAMGIVGTDVAKESADIVLTDDNFATIVSAVEEGRRIYDNILKAIQFLLSSNVGEIITLFVATMFNLIEPLVPIHILWINLVTDSLPALALSVDPAESNIMKRKAKKSSNIFSKGMIWRIVYQGIMIGFLTLLAYSLGCGFNYTTMTEETLITAQTMAFGVLALSQLVHVFNIRSNTQSIFKVKFSTNNILIGASAISSLLMFIVLEVPFLHKIFNVATLGFTNWIIVIGLSLAPLLIVEIFKLLKINTFKDENI